MFHAQYARERHCGEALHQPDGRAAVIGRVGERHVERCGRERLDEPQRVLLHDPGLAGRTEPVDVGLQGTQRAARLLDERGVDGAA